MASSMSYSWSTAPAEIRLQILENLLPLTKSRAASITRYACVCAEWQHFFESFTFRRLLLDNNSVRHFTKVTQGKNVARLSYICYLELCIKLRRHYAPHSYSPENWQTISQNNRTFSVALKRLFQALSRGTPGDEKDQGLILEITSSSLSDTKSSYHAWFDNEVHQKFRLSEDLEASRFKDFLYQKYREAMTPEIRMLYSRFTHPARIDGTPLKFTLKGDLPQVPIVRTLWLRKQFYRGVAAACLVQLLQKSLTSVTSLRYERWVQYDFLDGVERSSKALQSLILGLPSNIEVFSFNEWLRGSRCNGEVFQYHRPWGLISECMAQKARDLVQLCPPWRMSIWKFLVELRQPLPSTKRSNLKHLCLEHSNPDCPVQQQEITHLLSQVAITALCLPSLELLEVWGTATFYGFIFRYEQSDRQATITWIYTSKGVILETGTIEAWSNVATMRDLKLAVVKEILPEVDDDVNEDGGLQKFMYQHLKLCDLVIDPVTLEFFEST